MHSEPAPGESDRRSILEQLAKFASFSGGTEDNAAYLRDFSSEAVLLPPSGPPVIGSTAIRRFYDTQLKGISSAHVNYTDVLVDIEASVAVRRYTGTAVVQYLDRQAPVVLRTRYTDVLNRTADQQWLITVHMWIYDGPDPPHES